MLFKLYQYYDRSKPVNVLKKTQWLYCVHVFFFERTLKFTNFQMDLTM